MGFQFIAGEPDQFIPPTPTPHRGGIDPAMGEHDLPPPITALVRDLGGAAIEAGASGYFLRRGVRVDVPHDGADLASPQALIVVATIEAVATLKARFRLRLDLHLDALSDPLGRFWREVVIFEGQPRLWAGDGLWLEGLPWHHATSL